MYKVYACGGAGINLTNGVDINNDRIVVIDTSKSNLKKVEGDREVYLVEGMSGAGKVRKTSHSGSKDELPDILFKHQPSDINIIVSSASGGSGSVLSYLLMDELMRQNKTVVMVLVGSYDSIVETENTLKTLTSLAGLVKKHQKPVVCFFEENISDGTSNGRFRSDEYIKTFLVLMARIASGESSEELDITDIKNFFDYTVATEYPPSLVYLDTLTGVNMVDTDKGNPVSALSIIGNHDTSYQLNVPVPYQAVGVISQDLKTDQLHLITLDGYFLNKIKEIETMLAEMKSNVPRKKSIEVDSTDIVL